MWLSNVLPQAPGPGPVQHPLTEIQQWIKLGYLALCSCMHWLEGMCVLLALDRISMCCYLAPLLDNVSTSPPVYMHASASIASVCNAKSNLLRAWLFPPPLTVGMADSELSTNAQALARA